MKRDMNLVRRLLVLIEEQDSTNEELHIPEDLDREVVVYHLQLMEQADLTKNRILYADNKPLWIYSSLKWEGHEFLDAIRSETVWNKLKEVVKEKGGSIPFEIMKALAVDLAKKFIIG